MSGGGRGSSGAFFGAASERIRGACRFWSACGCAPGHPLNAALGEWEELDLETGSSAAATSFRDHDGVLPHLIVPTNHFGGEIEHPLQGHFIKLYGDFGNRLTFEHGGHGIFAVQKETLVEYWNMQGGQ